MSSDSNDSPDEFDSFILKQSSIEIDFELISTDRLRVKYNKSHPMIPHLIRLIPDSELDETARTATIPLSEVWELERSFTEDLGVAELDLSMPPRATLYWLEKFGTSQIPSDLSELIPQEMLDRLFDYQKDGVRFILEREGRALIADESGLGKTWQALTAMMAYKVDWPVLIVCPSSAKHVWQKEITKLLPEDEDRKVMTINRYDDELPEEDEENVIVIMSYGIMTRKLNELLEIPFKIVIFDESHKLKERKTQRSQAAIKIADAAERVILLSATPALSRPNELWMQLRLIDDRVYPKFKQFGDRYCEGYYNTDLEYYDSRGCSHHKELRTILYSRFTIRRTKAKELADLPSKKRELIYLSNELIDYTERRLLEARREYIQYLLDCEANERDINVYHASVTDYYTQTGIAKASAVSNYIVETYFGEAAEEENKGKKLLVFAYHLDVLDAIQEENEPEIRVALLSLITGGFALNLTAATSVIFAELYWNPTYHEQAEDRAHRIGQTERVECKYLMSEDTADEMVWSSIEAKLVVLGKLNLSNTTFHNADRSFRALLDSPEHNDNGESDGNHTDDNDNDSNDSNGNDDAPASAGGPRARSRKTITEMRDERRDSGVVIDEDSDEDTYTPVKKRVRKSAIQSDSSRESTPDRDANSASKSNYRRIVVSSDEDETPRKKRKQHDAFSSDSSQEIIIIEPSKNPDSEDQTSADEQPLFLKKRLIKDAFGDSD